MKNLLISACLVVTLISCKKETKNKLSTQNNSVSITYNTIKPIDSFRLLQPINGKDYYLFENKLDSISTFKININKPQLISINRTALFVEPNENYTINEIKHYGNINEYFGKNSAGQEFLNTLKTYNNDQLAVQSIKNNTIEQAFIKLDSIFQIDFNRLDSLNSNKLVNKSFRKSVKQKLNFDKTFTKSRVIFRSFMRTVKDTSNFKNEFDQNDIALFNKLYKDNPINDINNQSNRHWYEYAKSYICINNILTSKKSFEYSTDGQFNNPTNFLNVAKHLLNKETLEYFTACYLFEHLINYHYSKKIVAIYENFKKEYPNSTYLPYLIKNLEVLKEYPKRINQPLSPKIKFATNSIEINTLEKLINLNKGNRTYLVFWKDDFSESKRDFNALLKSKPFFKKHNIDIVYLSLSNLTDNENAKDIIHYYNLEGKHLSAGKNLLNDIKSKTQVRRYPRYMIINKEGEVVQEDAVWPRRSNYFEKELIEKLKL